MFLEKEVGVETKGVIGSIQRRVNEDEKKRDVSFNSRFLFVWSHRQNVKARHQSANRALIGHPWRDGKIANHRLFSCFGAFHLSEHKKGRMKLPSLSAKGRPFWR